MMNMNEKKAFARDLANQFEKWLIENEAIEEIEVYDCDNFLLSVLVSSVKGGKLEADIILA